MAGVCDTTMPTGSSFYGGQCENPLRFVGLIFDRCNLRLRGDGASARRGRAAHSPTLTRH